MVVITLTGLTVLLLVPLLFSSAESHFVNSSLVPVPSAVRNYTLNTSDVRMLFEAGDCACFCKLSREWTVCVGKECVHIPRTIKIFNQRLRVSGTEITSIGPLDFANYGDLMELQLDSNLLTTIENGTFVNLRQLVNLSISSNRLASIPPGAFQGLTSLRSLRLIKNRFLALSDVVPSLVPLTTLRFLSLSENTLGRVDAADFASMRFSSLETLELSNCDLKYVDSEAFMPFKKLKRLILSENTMPEDNLIYLIHTMRESGLKALDLSQLRFAGSPPRTMLEALSHTDVEELNLSKNTLPRLSPKIFPLMPHIRDLDLSACGIITIENGTFSLMPLLMRLNLAENGLEDIPPAVMILPQLKWLSLSGNAGSHGGHDYGGGELKLLDGNFAFMSNLTYLDLSFNRIGQVTKGIFLGLSRLEELDLRNNSLYRLMEGCFKPLVSLKVLHLDGNAFGKQNFSRATLEGLTSLEYLNMDRCKLSFTDQEAIFAGAPRLKKLSLRENKIVSFGSRNPFADATSLVSVDLFKNRIRGWDTPLFASSPNLDVLNLAENQISHVSFAMMKDIANLSEADLLGNPIDCDCQLEPLRRYAVHHTDTEESNLLIKADHCYSPDKWRFSPITNFLLALQPDDCLNIQAATDDSNPDESDDFVTGPHVIALYVLIPTICLLALAGYAFYRTRWVIRYYLFRKRLSQTNLMTVSPSMAELEGSFKYDAFVSYSNVDHAFVARLVAMLENAPPNYKLCVYERDFTAGNVLNDCIMQSITTSRKVVLIISENFVQSHWCLWELHLAQHSLLEEKRNGLILVVVGKLKLNQLPPTLRFLMKTRIYLEWDPDPSRQRLFWERLREALAPSPQQKITSLSETA